ncbi:hypothetical protein V3R04_27365, partial [Escherichia coli]|uniref:hypothetical protein n=1 Tax=Escherichia coli TaxID=562 RepID=UPI002F30B89B
WWVWVEGSTESGGRRFDERKNMRETRGKGEGRKEGKRKEKKKNRRNTLLRVVASRMRQRCVTLDATGKQKTN